MKCKKLMTKNVVAITPDAKVEEAARRMRDRNIGFLPVIDDTGHVWGVLTDRDIAIRVVGSGLDPRNTTVNDVMSREVVACRPTDDLADVQILMAKHKKSRILVTDKEATLLGMLSLADIALIESPRRAGKTLRRVAQREVASS